MADRCNTSATSRAVQHRRRWRTVATASISTPPPPLLYLYFAIPLPSHLISRSFSPLSLFVPPCLPFSYNISSILTDSIPLIPSLRYHLLFLHSCPPRHIPPTLSNPPGSSQRCTTHVLTERRTSDLRGSRCNPLRVRHPPGGGRLGVAPRSVLSPSRLSRRLSSRLETIRYAGDPGPSTSNASSR